ncbi:MAG: hypothetical protein U5L09_13675 [Bacteroidales bacterium]|nr:hypothetical protein [Bacteroidales bacterium]
MPGEAVTLDIYYHGAPFSEAWGGFHFAGNYAFNLGGDSNRSLII